MIKIVSGFSWPSGSTVALVNLCNQFNSKGYDCTLYGSDNWQLDKCKSAKISDFHPEKGDIIIVHNINLFSVSELYNLQAKIAPPHKKRWIKAIINRILKDLPGSRKLDGIKLILTCQENELFPLKGLKTSLFDKIHYQNELQREYHKIQRPYFLCPNFIDDLTKSESKPEKIAGVIGSIRRENKTDLSIEKALQDGMNKVIIYGFLRDPIYYYNKIEPLAKKYPEKVKFAGFIDNKQKIYDSISDVYSSSIKPWSFVEEECKLTGTNYHGINSSKRFELTQEEIFKIWKKELEL